MCLREQVRTYLYRHLSCCQVSLVQALWNLWISNSYSPIHVRSRRFDHCPCHCFHTTWLRRGDWCAYECKSESISTDISFVVRSLLLSELWALHMRLLSLDSRSVRECSHFGPPGPPPICQNMNNWFPLFLHIHISGESLCSLFSLSLSLSLSHSISTYIFQDNLSVLSLSGCMCVCVLRLEAEEEAAYQWSMLDLNLFRLERGGNPEAIRDSQRRRHGEDGAKLVDDVIELDRAWRLCSKPQNPRNSIKKT